MKRKFYKIKFWICEKFNRVNEYPDDYYLLNEDSGSSYNGEFTRQWHYVEGVGHGFLSNWWVYIWNYDE